MNFSVSYAGSPGNISAQLICDGKPINKTNGLKNGRDAKRWAKATANEYKAEQAAPESGVETTTVYISGAKTFTL